MVTPLVSGLNPERRDGTKTSAFIGGCSFFSGTSEKTTADERR
jgi:hypothetical protein